jgi:hypothetical protein
VVAVFIWNITDEVDPVPEMLAINYVFNVPCTVLVPTADTNEQEENEQAVLGKMKYSDNNTDD